MLNRLRQRLSNEQGFTLIELLVVILIIGILAAIAIPAFLSQTSKANDSAAKTQVGTLQTTEEAYASENGGSFTPELTKLQAIEPTLKDTSTATAKVNSGSGENFVVQSTAATTGDVYILTSTGGSVSRTCTTVANSATNTSGGCKGGSW
jgi:type IV pilus assembly protein PilA